MVNNWLTAGKILHLVQLLSELKMFTDARGREEMGMRLVRHSRVPYRRAQSLGIGLSNWSIIRSFARQDGTVFWGFFGTREPYDQRHI